MKLSHNILINFILSMGNIFTKMLVILQKIFDNLQKLIISCSQVHTINFSCSLSEGSNTNELSKLSSKFVLQCDNKAIDELLTNNLQIYSFQLIVLHFAIIRILIRVDDHRRHLILSSTLSLLLWWLASCSTPCSLRTIIISRLLIWSSISLSVISWIISLNNTKQ